MLKSWLVVLNSLSFWLVCKAFDFSLICEWDLCWYSNLSCRFFSLIILSMSCNSLLAWRISIERPPVILMGIPLCFICCFSLASFNICYLCLTFLNLINMYLQVFHFEFILFRILWVSWNWVAISFSILENFSTIISSRILSWAFYFLSSSSGTPMSWMLGRLTLSQRSLRLSSFLLIHFFSFSLYASFISTILSFTLNFTILAFRLKLKKLGKTTRPFRYDLNQILYYYTLEVRDRFKGLNVIDRVPDEL